MFEPSSGTAVFLEFRLNGEAGVESRFNCVSRADRSDSGTTRGERREKESARSAEESARSAESWNMDQE